ncbi:MULTISPECIES: aldo/keto reductase [unclassified Desulfovibrio]|uniref:aldo/keto reductase n=1 Tax=unclassified Desulfovibrio TaxID=2593640 RepID=UPI002FD94D14
MEYRTFPKGGERISTVGIGGSKLHAVSHETMKTMVDYAIANGINIIDLATETAEVFPKVRKALAGRRDKVMLALHLGLTFQEDGQYKRTRDLEEVRRGFEKQLADLDTDYADIAYIHYVDDFDDYERVFAEGTYNFGLQLKREGRIKKLGFASHRVDVARKFLEQGDFDLFMFSINPAYDLDPVANNPLEEDWSAMNSLNVAEERVALYRLAEKLGVGITVMKPLGAGRLLDGRTSPFGRALTVPQCLQYCLDRPAVLSCMLGADSVENLTDWIAYYDSTREERDYAFIADLHFEEMLGKCVYCNHCLPCPVNIDIARVNKFLDLAQVGDELARQHYLALEHKAGDCIQCGSCEGNCPFQVPVRDKMKEAAELFGA